MKSDPVYVVKDNKLYEYLYDYETSSNHVTHVCDNVLSVSKYMNGEYYYIKLDGTICCSRAVLMKVKDLPVRIDNVGNPMLVYEDRLVIMDEYLKYEILVADAPNVCVLHSNSYGVFMHDNNCAIIYTYKTMKYDIHPAHHFIIDDNKYYIGNVDGNEYTISFGEIVETMLCEVYKKVYNYSDYEDYKPFGNKYFSSGKCVCTFNYMKSEISKPLILYGGCHFQVGNKFYVVRHGNIYLESKAYNEFSMICIGDEETIKL
jgi:hypothetical protein